MSSLHITSWTPQDIGKWIKGLDNALEQYIPNFIEHQVTGDRLLKLTIEELDALNITKMGHKELMLEAVDLLSVVHYGHPSETLQSVALKLNTNASNLANLLQQCTQSRNHAGDRLYSPPSTILLRVSETISAAKTLISWLDRPPFSNNSEKDFQEFSKEILQYALDMTQAVQQQSNLTDALPEIMAIAREFTAITDNLIRQSTDPLVIQPTTVEEVRIRKKQLEEELPLTLNGFLSVHADKTGVTQGLFIKTSTIDGIHYITGTKEQSAANLSRKVGSGDELLRVNEQTVVSWEHRKVIEALKADPMGVYLTLRKRPCNLGSPGQILRPSSSQYPPLFGTPLLRRNDSFTNMRSPVVNEDFLMPASPSELLATKARSNSDPEPPSDTHETQSDPDQEAERIKRQRRGTMGESLQRKGSKGTVTSEGRPRSLPINTEELEAEMALIKASGISARPGFSPIAGSPPTASTQTTPSPHGDRTLKQTLNQLDTPSPNTSCLARKVTISEEKDSNAGNPPPSTSVSKVDPEDHKPTHNDKFQEVQDSPAPEDNKQNPEPNQRTEEEPGEEETHSTPETAIEPSSENSEAKNTNNNVAALKEAAQPEVTTTSSEITTFDKEDYVVVEAPPASPKSSAANLSRKVGSGDELLRVNEQTVVSWEHRKVIEALKADPMGVYLTLRKRPCNLGSPGQILRPSSSQYPPLFGTPLLRRNDSFTNMRSPVVNEDFLMPASPSELLATKARSNSDPEPPSDTHETQSDPDQEAERIKRQRRGTMGESLQRKGSKGTVTSEGRPRSLPINTEELEAEMALIKASGISARPGFSPIAGSPPTASTQTTPSPHGDRTLKQTLNQLDTPSPNTSCLARKVTISEEKDSNAGNPPPSTSVSKVDPEDHKPTHNDKFQEVQDSPAPEDNKQNPEPNQRTEEEPGEEETHSTPETAIEPSSENSEAKNTNNNVAALKEAAQPEVTTTSSEITTFDKEDYVVVEAPPASPKSVTFLELRKQSSASSLSSIPSPTVGVKLRPKKTKRKYKVTRDVSCVDLGPGSAKDGFIRRPHPSSNNLGGNVDIKAKGLVCLPGYQILEAPETKKEHAFKATHKGATTLYFAAKHVEERKKWVDRLRLASILFKEEKKMRQSFIFQSEDSLDMGDMMRSVDGYHSESDDEEKDKRSDQSAPLSPSSSDRSEDTSSEAGSPQRSPTKKISPISPKTQPGTPTSSPKLFHKRATKRDPFGSSSATNSPKGSPKIMQRMLGALRRHSRGSLSIDLSELEALEKSSKRRNSTPYDISLSPPPVAEAASMSVSESATSGPSPSATPLRGDDPLLDSYKTIMDTNGCVVGFERTAVRTSKRYTNKDKSSLRRIHTVLDKDPKKNKKALQRRALQRTLKAKQTELQILSKVSLTSEGIQQWKRDHEDLLDNVLKGPKPDSPSDSGSDLDCDQDTEHHTDDSKSNGNDTSTQETVDDEKKDSEEMASENAVSGNNSDVQSDDQGLPSQSETSTKEIESTAASDSAAEAENVDDGLLEPGPERNGVEPSPEVETSTADTVVSGMVRTTLVLDENFRPRTGSAPSETSF